MPKNITARFKFIDEMSDKMASVADAGQRMATQFDKAGDAASRALQSIDGGFSSAVTSVDGVATSIAGINGAAGNAAASTDALTQSAAGAMSASDQLADAAAEAADGVEELGEKAQETSENEDKLGESGESAIDKLTSAFASAGVIALVKELGDGLMDAADAAATAETAFAKLQTIAGADAMPMLTDQIKELSATTGIAQADLADVAYNAISAGAAVDEAAETASAAAQLASAGFTETSSALSILSTTMNSYGDAAGTAEDISNSLIMVQNLGVTTVADLAASMGRAISTAAAYNVTLGNLESAYVSVTKAGINTSEATTYIAGMMTELGSESSEVSKILKEQTGQSFGQLMSSGMSLADVLDILYNSVNQDAEALMNLWGSQTAGVASAAIINQGLDAFNNNLVTIENSAGATSDAYSVMADTTEFAEKKMQNSIENLKIAIGDNLTPVLGDLYGAGSKAFDWAAKFVSEHPVVMKAVTAAGVGLGAMAVGIAGVGVAALTTIPAIASFAAAVSAAIWPLTAVAAGIAAVTGAVLVAKGNYDDAYDSVMSMTASTELQTEKLESLQQQYEAACDQYGATSEEASRLKYQIDDLSASIEANGQSVEEMCEECDALVEKHEASRASFEDSMDAINGEEMANMALIQKLEDLANSTDQTTESQAAMEAIISQLNKNIDGLNLTYEDFINNQDGIAETMKKQAEAMAEQMRYEENQKRYAELLIEREDAANKLAEAEKEVTAATDRASEAEAAYMDRVEQMSQYDQTGFASLAMLWSDEKASADAASEALDDAVQAQETYQKEVDAADAEMQEIMAEWGNLEDAVESETEAEEDWQGAVTAAYQGVEENLVNLCESYNEAYESARESLEGQFGLFDEASMKSDEYTNSTVANAQEALDSQLAYWDSYAANLETLKGMSAESLGISQENYNLLMSYVQSGSEEAAGLAASMVEQIQNGNTEAVTEMANTAGEVQARQEEISESVADWQTGFNATMEQLVTEMDDTVVRLNLSDEAEESAKATIDAYAKQITASGGAAIRAAEDIASQVSAALEGAIAKTSGAKLTAASHANGTTSAESVFIAGERGHELIARHADAYAVGTTDSSAYYLAGENGPELIIGEPGSTVFPTSETDRILDAIDDRDRPMRFMPRHESGHDEPSGAGEQIKRIVLEIAGSGSINVGAGTDRDSILTVLQENLKPVLMSLIQSEIYEEGDLSYEY